MTLHDVVEKGQATPLAPQRTLSDASEVCVAVIFATIEHGDDTHILHLSVLHNGVEDNLPVGIHIL